MSRVKVVFYADEGDCPVIKWLESLPDRVSAKALVRIERLEQLGHELRRPEADFLRDGIHELRFRWQTMNYRILYGFHGRQVVVLLHGIVKEDAVPSREIETAIRRKRQFDSNPEKFSYEEGVS